MKEQVGKPLYWHQGLFLQPQHLQLGDLYHNSRLQPIQRYSHPFFWGTTGFEIQETALSNRSFELVRAEIMFPDGSYLTFPGNTVAKPRSFEDSWLEGDKPFVVYLGLRKWNPAGRNVTVIPNLNATEGVTTRWVATSDPEELPDYHSDGPPGQVRHLSFVLQVFWETELEQLDNFHLMPIAILERDGEDVLLSRRFVPPSLSLSAADWLLQTVKDVREQITSRGRQLEEYKSPRQTQGMEFDIGYIVFLLALRSLNRYVPLLNHILETRDVHPWDAYALLRQLIGELSTFSAGLSATGERTDGTVALPPYNHHNLWPCFSAAQKLVGELLDSITVGPGHLIRLEYDGTYYTGEVSENMLDSKNRFWLVLRTEAPTDTVTSAVQHVVKLSARTHITTLIARAIPGIPLEYFQIPPPGLPRRAHSFYYRIDHTSPQWLDVGTTKTISLFWDTAPQDLVAEILVLRS